MTVKKLKNDVLSHLDEIINNGHAPGFPCTWLRNTRDRIDHVKFKKDKAFWSESNQTPCIAPVFLFSDKNGSDLEVVFIFQNSAYVVTGHFSEEEKSLLVQAEHDKERSKFERLKRKFELAQNLDEKPKRRPIPEDVRVAVWRRDQGTCVRCGSRKRLEYDHIIPVVEGGGDSVRNVELLCESCNRSKGANIQ